MSVYKKQEWIDHIEDVDTGELLQEGTLYCARLMNHMENGIYSAHDEMIQLEMLLRKLQTRLDILEGNVVNEMPHNNFLEDFSSLKDINLIDGVYDSTLAKIYISALGEGTNIPTENLTVAERVMSLMYPMPQRHDYVPHGAPGEWKYQSKMYNDTKPTGWSAVNARLQVYRVEGSNYACNTGVEIKDFNVYGWKNNRWYLVKEISIPQGAFYAVDLTENANTNFSDSIRINSNSITIRLNPNMLVNTSDGVRDVCYFPELGLTNYDADFEYIFISAKMRKVKWDQSGIDDLKESRYCASCRGQWWEKVGSIYDTNYSEIAQAKFTEVTTEWNVYGLTTVPEGWSNGFPIAEI